MFPNRLLFSLYQLTVVRSPSFHDICSFQPSAWRRLLSIVYLEYVSRYISNNYMFPNTYIWSMHTWNHWMHGPLYTVAPNRRMSCRTDPWGLSQPRAQRAHWNLQCYICGQHGHGGEWFQMLRQHLLHRENSLCSFLCRAIGMQKQVKNA